RDQRATSVWRRKKDERKPTPTHDGTIPRRVWRSRSRVAPSRAGSLFVRALSHGAAFADTARARREHEQSSSTPICNVANRSVGERSRAKRSRLEGRAVTLDAIIERKLPLIIETFVSEVRVYQLVPGQKSNTEIANQVEAFLSALIYALRRGH